MAKAVARGREPKISVGQMRVNAARVRRGYAPVATCPPNVRYQERFLTLQREAREATRGLWGAQ